MSGIFRSDADIENADVPSSAEDGRVGIGLVAALAACGVVGGCAAVARRLRVPRLWGWLVEEENDAT